MKTIILALALIGAPALALADPRPVRAPPDQAVPDGYTRSGGYAVPKSDRAKTAIPRRNGEPCPYGYYGSGSSCLSYR